MPGTPTPLNKPLTPDELASLVWREPYLELPLGALGAAIVPHVRALFVPELEPVVVGRDPDGSAKLDSHRRVPVAHAGWMIWLPYETNPLPANLASRASHHWAHRARAVAAVRETAFVLARRWIPAQPGITVRLDWEVTTKRTRDEDNLVPLMKALVDGVRSAGVVPDDDRRYVHRIMPEINLTTGDPSARAHMRLWIWKRASESKGSGDA